MLNTYDNDAREDIADMDHLRNVMDELITVLNDLDRRIQALEDASRR